MHSILHYYIVHIDYEFWIGLCSSDGKINADDEGI